MRISERLVDDVAVVDVSGKLALADVPGRLKEKISALLYNGHRQIVINLAGVNYVDSSGLGELVACHLTAVRHNAAIRIANTGTRTRELLMLTKLNSVFDTYPSEKAAIASFRPRLALAVSH